MRKIVTEFFYNSKALGGFYIFTCETNSLCVKQIKRSILLFIAFASKYFPT